MDSDVYDAVIYDVLGDVVCGGFAAPMRKSARSKVVIVLSEELMAVYAANRIAAAVREFHSNDVRLAGLVINLKSNQADIRPIQRFAESIGTRILGVLPRDPLVCEAEIYRQCIVQYAPESPVAVGVQAVIEAVLALDRNDIAAPEPLEEQTLRQIMRGISAEEPLPTPPPIEMRKSKVTERSQVGRVRQVSHSRGALISRSAHPNTPENPRVGDGRTTWCLLQGKPNSMILGPLPVHAPPWSIWTAMEAFSDATALMSVLDPIIASTWRPVMSRSISCRTR